MSSNLFNTYIAYDEWVTVEFADLIERTKITVQIQEMRGVYLDAFGGYMAHRLDEHDAATAQVDFNLRQAYKMVIMTVANEAALPTTSVAEGQPIYCAAENTLHICTSAS